MIGRLGAAGVALLACVFQGHAPPAPRAEPGTLGRLAWLSGTWFLEESGRVTEEHWRPAAGTLLLGTSHTYDAERTRAFEFLRISATDEGLSYVAQPGGAPPTVFRATTLGEGEVVFENPAHDQPQRIRYERTEAGITATISQLDGSRSRSFAFRRR